MPDVPNSMLKNQRPRVQEFDANELLYRRVPLDLWEDPADDIEVDAVALPDMSVLRSRFAHPEWARLEDDAHAEWGVIGFQVHNIPSDLLHLGVFKWTFGPRHVPLDENYPHSEVWAYENAQHINAKDRIDPDLHLRWRHRLLENIEKVLNPREVIAIRQEPPLIH